MPREQPKKCQKDKKKKKKKDTVVTVTPSQQRVKAEHPRQSTECPWAQPLFSLGLSLSRLMAAPWVPQYGPQPTLGALGQSRNL